MSNLPAKRRPGDGTLAPRRLPKVGPYDLYEALLVDSMCENTRRSRVDVIKALCTFLGEEDPRAACATVISGGRSQATAVAASFRQYLIRGKAAGATINNRLSALRRLVALANEHELIDWRFTVKDMKVTPFRNTRGPTLDQWSRLWAAAVKAGNGTMAVRNRAIVRLMRDVGLRKGEVIALDLDDLDLDGERVAITAKGHCSETLWVTISPKCVELLREWLAVRGADPGPVFISRPVRAAREEVAKRVTELRASGLTHRQIAEVFNAEGTTTATGLPWTIDRIEQVFDRRKWARSVRRLPDREVNRIVYALAKAAGLGRTVRPHSLRHHAITRVLDLTNGNIRMAQKLARHANVNHTLLYDDNRVDLAGDCVRLLSADD